VTGRRSWRRPGRQKIEETAKLEINVKGKYFDDWMSVIENPALRKPTNFIV
jgi:hypothetical protein